MLRSKDLPHTHDLMFFGQHLDDLKKSIAQHQGLSDHAINQNLLPSRRLQPIHRPISWEPVQGNPFMQKLRNVPLHFLSVFSRLGPHNYLRIHREIVVGIFNRDPPLLSGCRTMRRLQLPLRFNKSRIWKIIDQSLTEAQIYSQRASKRKKEGQTYTLAVEEIT